MEKGLVKLNNFSNNPKKAGYKYLLTPKGIEQKSKLTIKFLKIKSLCYLLSNYCTTTLFLFHNKTISHSSFSPYLSPLLLPTSHLPHSHTLSNPLTYLPFHSWDLYLKRHKRLPVDLWKWHLSGCKVGVGAGWPRLGWSGGIDKGTLGIDSSRWERADK